MSRLSTMCRLTAAQLVPTRTLAAMLVLGCTLAACSVGPDYKRPKVDTPPAFKEAEGWKVAEPNDTAPKGNWWDVYNDPALDNLVKQVQVSNQNVMVAEAQYRQALALVSQARANYFPLITADASSLRSQNALVTGVSGTGTSTGTPTTGNPGTGTGTGGGSQNQTIPGATGTRNVDRVSLSLSWEIDVWGRIRRQVESNKAAAVASESDLANALLSAQAMLVQSYVQLRATDTDIDLYEKSVAAYDKALKITMNRYEAGVAQRTDVTQAQGQLESAKAAGFDLQVTRATLEHAIAVLVGKPPAELSIERTNQLPNIPETPVSVPAALLERRPDIAGAERRAAAANALIGVARAAYFPELSLTGSGGYESNTFNHLFSVPNRFWSLGPELAQTVFDAGAIHAQVKQNIAAYDASVATYRQTVLAAFQDVEDNLATLKWLSQEAVAQAAAAAAAEQTLSITENQYQAGTVDYLNVVIAQQSALTAERAVRDLANRRLTASVGLLKALGGGWQTTMLTHE
ncbi:MAG TPA: efflux transporter outer membrane subunit [Steroidobacteraceae bacterium]|nr:efflux transporter outer membrane subunit [Steroidobacteraceae bacterium]